MAVKARYKPSVLQNKRGFSDGAGDFFWFMLLLAALCWGRLAKANEVSFLAGTDTVQMGRAAGGVASPRSASWMLLNPASIVDLDRRLDLSLFSVFSKLTIDPAGIGSNWSYGETSSDEVGVVPTGGIILPWKGGTLGLGLYMPLGGELDYGHSRNILASASPEQPDRRMVYIHGRLVLAYAYRFENGWALGMGLHGSLSRCRSDHATPHLVSTQGDNQWDQALGAGFGLGLYRRWERFSVGLGYTSPHWVESFKKYQDLLWERVDLPQSFQAGIAYRFAPRWEFSADFKYQDWGAMKFFGGKPEAGGLHWKDQRVWKAALDWQATDRVRLYAGFSHANTPIDPDHVFLSALTPACVENLASLGFTISVGKQAEINFAYLHAFEHRLEESGKGGFYSFIGRGTSVSTEADCISVGYTIHF